MKFSDTFIKTLIASGAIVPPHTPIERPMPARDAAVTFVVAALFVAACAAAFYYGVTTR